jgi:hypothetical protein
LLLLLQVMKAWLTRCQLVWRRWVLLALGNEPAVVRGLPRCCMPAAVAAAADGDSLADRVSAGVAQLGLSEPAVVRRLPSKEQQATAAHAAAEAPAGQA